MRAYGPLSRYTRAIVRHTADKEKLGKSVLGALAAGEYNYISHLANAHEPAKYEAVSWVAKLAKDPWPENLR